MRIYTLAKRQGLVAPALAIAAVMALVLIGAGCATSSEQGVAAGAGAAAGGLPQAKPLPKEAWRGVHLPLASRDELPLLHRALEEVLAPHGVNTIILEVNYCYQFASHPELASPNAMTREDARQLVDLCRRLHVRLIPQFQCFGHQGSRPGALLAKYPELMAPPKPNYDDPDFYQLSYNPLHPKTNEIVFALIDELVAAFEPEAFHVGLDEVMLFPDATTPYYNGETHAQIFAKAVNDLHAHVVKEKGLTMLMWGDRLIDQKTMRYSRYESSRNETAPAIDMIPKDIIICDWHYNRMADYPSVRFFQEKGFRVWPASWKSPEAALALLECSEKDATERMIGHMCTTWCGVGNFLRAVLGENMEERAAYAHWAAQTFFTVAAKW